jgi:hypothetical protein
MGRVKYTSFTYYCYCLLPAEDVIGDVGPTECDIALAVMFIRYRLLAYLTLHRIRM